MIDTMRGIVSGGDDAILEANTTAAEVTNPWNLGKLTSTGFQIEQGGASVNENGTEYIYIAIRGSDGYVTKPALAGTDAFAMDTSNAQGTIPCFDSAFPADFALLKKPATTENWGAAARLTSGKYMIPNNADSDNTGSDFTWDSNVGWGKGLNSANQSWMWKRGAGFDTVTYTGNGATIRKIPHGLGRVPEMIWVKSRGSGYDWFVYHKGLNGGVNPEQYKVLLNSNGAESIAGVTMWQNTAPDKNVFTVGNMAEVNQNSVWLVAYLFASVDGISKCGYYDGQGSELTITTGFQPRFVIIKVINHQDGWVVLDTTRGWGSGNDQFLQLDINSAQAASDAGAPTSTGFTLTVADVWNNANRKYIYYAHA